MSASSSSSSSSSSSAKKHNKPPPTERAYSGRELLGPIKGRLTMIANSPSYVTEPSGNDIYPQNAILFFTDIAGVRHDIAMLADQFAAAGYLTVVCNNADRWAKIEEIKNAAGRYQFLPGKEVSSIGLEEADVDTLVNSAFRWLRRARGITGKIGAVGYGSGGAQVLRLLNIAPNLVGEKEVETWNKIAAGFIADIDFDSIEDMRQLGEMRGPLSLAWGDEDKIFDESQRKFITDQFKTDGQPYQTSLYSHVKRGFAVRRAVSSAAEIYAKKQAFIQAISWLDEHLLDESA